MKATKRDLIGRKIVAVDFRRFGRNIEGHQCYVGKDRLTTDPLITLDNGRTLWLVVDETDIGDYGVSICISERPSKKRSGGA